ncbi:FecR domain-containing protein [Phocaeicola abscessus]|uniref:FecR family protein n=1 Tax=Phocaeicola abscessus TaxID=555313 RepID=UPI0028E42888|nr:FecR domain-containing protein [Phocaeicola abscessus]
MEIDKELLKRYIEGRASDRERMLAYRWISAHPQHLKRYLTEKRLYELSLFRFAENKRESLTEKKKGIVALKKVRITRGVKYAAAAVCLLLAIASLWNRFTKHPDAAALQTVYVPTAQMTSLTLDDGTLIELGSNSKLSFPPVFDRKERDVYLSGRAFFKVAKNRRRPFVVTTRDGAITVTGTTFYVDAIPERNIFTVSLIEGQVLISLNKEIEKPLRLKPKDRAVLKNGRLVVSPIVDYDEFLWREGILSFKGKNLEEIISQLSLLYNLKISIQNCDLSLKQSHTYSGKFRQLDGIDYALQVLKQKIGFDYKHDEQTGEIYIR